MLVFNTSCFILKYHTLCFCWIFYLPCLPGFPSTLIVCPALMCFTCFQSPLPPLCIQVFSSGCVSFSVKFPCAPSIFLLFMHFDFWFLFGVKFTNTMMVFVHVSGSHVCCSSALSSLLNSSLLLFSSSHCPSSSPLVFSWNLMNPCENPCALVN